MRGQTTFGAGGRRANGALAVIGLVAGQVDGTLGEVRPQFGRHQKAVGQDEVNPRDGAAAHVAQIAGLHGGRAVGHDAVARPGGQAGQVDQHVDFEFADAPCGLGVAQRMKRFMVVKGPLHALAHGRGGDIAVVQAIDLHALAVVQLQHFGHQDADGVVLEVSRKIPDAQARVRPRGGRWQGQDVGGQFALNEALGRQALAFGLGQFGHGHEGADVQGHVFARAGLLQPVGCAGPAALAAAQADVVLHHVGLSWVQLQAERQVLFGFGEVLAVFLQTAQVVEQQAAALCGQGVAQCVLPGGQGLGALALVFQQQAQVDRRLVQHGVEGVGFFVGALFACGDAGGQQGGQVEVDGGGGCLLAVVCQPARVQRCRLGCLTCGLQLLGLLDQVCWGHAGAGRKGVGRVRGLTGLVIL